VAEDVMRTLTDGFATLTGHLAISDGGYANVSDADARFIRLFQQAADGLFCRSDVLENSADVFESLADVLENSADEDFCLILSVGETLECVGTIFQEPGHPMDYAGVALEEQVAASKAVGAEGKAIGTTYKAGGMIFKYVGCLEARRVSRVRHL
jgi:hypothetical protein